MAWRDVEEHLLYGWFEEEHGDGEAYRWAGGHSAVMVRVTQVTDSAFLRYRMAPSPAGEVRLSIRPRLRASRVVEPSIWAWCGLARGQAVRSPRPRRLRRVV